MKTPRMSGRFHCAVELSGSGDQIVRREADDAQQVDFKIAAQIAVDVA